MTAPEWVERARDQARLVAVACVQSSTGLWCDQHDRIKYVGQNCAALEDAYEIAELVVEVVEGLIRADERRQVEMAAVIDHEEIADEVRERIALEIEAEHTRCRPIPMLTGSFYFSCSHFEDARIARGGTR